MKWKITASRVLTYELTVSADIFEEALDKAARTPDELYDAVRAYPLEIDDVYKYTK